MLDTVLYSNGVAMLRDLKKTVKKIDKFQEDATKLILAVKSLVSGTSKQLKENVSIADVAVNVTGETEPKKKELTEEVPDLEKDRFEAEKDKFDKAKERFDKAKKRLEDAQDQSDLEDERSK